MRSRTATVGAAAGLAILLVSGLGVAASTGFAGAEGSPDCPADNLGCVLVQELEEALEPLVAPAPGSGPAATAASEQPGSTAAPDPVSGAGGAAAAADLSAAGPQIPAVPQGQALDLPPLTIPDLGGSASASPLARAARPVAVTPGGAALELDAAGQHRDGAPIAPLALALAVPGALVAVSLLARRRHARALG